MEELSATATRKIWQASRSASSVCPGLTSYGRIWQARSKTMSPDIIALPSRTKT
jgi:hypothetical protein